MSSLILVPTVPGTADGYQLAVASDLERLRDWKSPVTVVYGNTAMEQFGMRTIPRPSRASARYAANVVRGRVAAEVSPSQLRGAIRDIDDIDAIFCGDVIFYRAARALFPDVHLNVRIHNFYPLADYRQSMRRFPVAARLTYHFWSFSRLQSKILRDRNVTPIFITREEQQFARIAFPTVKSEFWPATAPVKQQSLRTMPTKRRLVHFGSASAVHTAVGIDLVCRRVLPVLRSRNPEYELHLYGSGSERFENPAAGVFGHGRYSGNGLPVNGDALFIVPDLHGCGVKMKLAELLRSAAPFVVTPFGVAGYDVSEADGALVVDIEDWAERIAAFFGDLDPEADFEPPHDRCMEDVRSS